METLIMSSPSPSHKSNSKSSPISIFSPQDKYPFRPFSLRFHISSKGRDDEFESHSESNETKIVPLSDNNNRFSLSPLSRDTAMGLVLNAATGRGWTTGSGMEGPPEPAVDTESSTAKISTFPWSLFTKSPRRRMLIAFTCNICSQRTTRAINPHAYTDGTVFVQCCGCNAYHKLVDNLNLFDGMKCYINSSFKGVNFEYRDIDNGDDGDGGFFGI